jgi:hypothetical protein
MVRIKQVEQTVILQGVVPAGLPKNSTFYMSVLLDPGLGAVQQIQIPPNEAWVFEDIYVKDAPGVDVLLTFQKNLTENVLKTAPLSVLVVSNPARPKIDKVLYESNTILTVVAQTLQDAPPNVPVTIIAYAKVRRFIAE